MVFLFGLALLTYAALTDNVFSNLHGCLGVALMAIWIWDARA